MTEQAGLGAPTRCAVLGDPIAHSLSPTLHRAGYAALGLDGWSYTAERVAEDELAAFLDGTGGASGSSAAGGAGGWRGLSLTMPLKRRVLDLVERRSRTVEESGVANTVVFENDGPRLENTDVSGARAALVERYAGPLEQVAILGGGATATSVLLAAADLGCRRFTLAVRNPDRARETVEVAGRRGGVEVEVVTLGTPLRADLVVSTIPAEAQTPELLAGLSGLAVLSGQSGPSDDAGVPAVFEVLYDPWPTPLVRRASEVGAPVVGGLDLLLHQAADQFALFTRQTAPLDAMRTAGERALTERAERAGRTG